MTPTSWLEKIQTPEDLKGLRIEAIEAIARDIRAKIAQTCSCNGGHFAPSLGVVELTLAMHYAFDAPRDRIVWDVGHQAYPHKLLTGRQDSFHTLRTLGGLSGFPKRDESPYDTFGVGHASTAISAALGMALARDQKGESHRVVAIVGDGSMGGGMCYEALNNLGWERPNMLVILNDNKMSIGPNIGAMSRYFNQLITTSLYNRSKRATKEFLQHIPILGGPLTHAIHRVQTSIKDLIVPEENFFEKMGIRYIGPVDGHDLPALIDTFEHVRDLEGPVLLHVQTIKGKGYKYSESDPEKWHSGANFEVDTGLKVKPEESETATPQPPSYTQVFSRTLIELAEQDPRIVAITAAMPSGTGLAAFQDRYPERFHDVGIAEPHAVCSAAGMACEGLRPVVAIYSSFLQRCFDNIIHDVALQKLPVTFAIDRAGIVGDDGPTHHGVFDYSFLRMIPNLVVMAPRDGEQLRRMMATAARYENGPIAYRYPRRRCATEPTDASPEPIEIGRGEVLRIPANERHDVVIIGVGTVLERALEAAEKLEQEGLGVGVVDMRFVKPLDKRLLLRCARDYDNMVTIEENVLAGGFGSAVNEATIALGEKQPVRNLGLPDTWIEHGPIDALLDLHGLSVDEITSAVRGAVAAHSEQPTSIQP